MVDRKENYDGVHFRGPHAARHFNYRAVQALKRIISGPVKQRIPQPRNRKVDDNHRSCPQAQYKLGRRGTNQRPVSSQSQGSNSGQESSGGSQGVSYYDVVSGSYKYSVPVDNRFDVLGN